MAIRSSLPKRVLLRYPNGRAYELALDCELRLGDRFEMYGRTWKVVTTRYPRRSQDGVPRIVCEPITPPHQ